MFERLPILADKGRPSAEGGAPIFEKIRSWTAVGAVVVGIFVVSIMVGYTAVGLEEHAVLDQLRRSNIQYLATPERAPGRRPQSNA